MDYVLGIDLAQSWANTGAALIGFDCAAQRVTSVDVGVLPAPMKAFSAEAVADVIHALATERGVCVVAIDGPLGWRDPSTPPEAKGVGRRCEVECRAQAKTGVYPKTYPSNQRPWVELSVALFDDLLTREHVVLANEEGLDAASGYAVLECFPTSLWRSSGLTALPGKNAKPDLGPYIDALRAAYDLPPFTTSSHDDLQAVVCALAGMALAGGPARPIPRGVPARLMEVDGKPRRIEGIIWDAAPLTLAVAATGSVVCVAGNRSGAQARVGLPRHIGTGNLAKRRQRSLHERRLTRHRSDG